MQLGNLIIYDAKGKIWYQSGEAEGDILEHIPPDGLPYKILPFGTINTHRVDHIDIKADKAVLIPNEKKIEAKDELIRLIEEGKLQETDVNIDLGIMKLYNKKV
jgi:hypothetical protein